MALDRREFLMTVAGAAAVRAVPAAADWRVGLASADITPPAGLWMAGYAARKEAAQGTAQPLHAKAIALQDAGGRCAAIVTLDLLGLTAPVVDRIATAVRRRHRLPRESLLLCSSHTHSGPVVDDQLAIAYDLTPAQWDDIRLNTRQIEEKVVALVGRALDARQPARLRSAEGRCAFGANRRVALNPDGPADPAVPVLSVERPDGTLAGLVFGYACHNTTLPPTFVRFHGDYAGVAQKELERRHPGTTACFVAGCGADANPSPRGTLDLAEQHGRSLADAVDLALTRAADVRGALRAGFRTVTLPYAPPPGPDEWRRRLESDNVYVRRHAKLMLEEVARHGHVMTAEDAPLHVLRVGTLSLVAIGGEVVVDYALAIKRRHGEATWVAGCTDSVFGYVPSARVLREGGYEGGDSMLYYGRPGPFTDAVESNVMTGVDALMASTAR